MPVLFVALDRFLYTVDSVKKITRYSVANLYILLDFFKLLC